MKGDRLSGTLDGPGADWVLMGGDGFGRLDVRCHVRTDDGEEIYASYDGVFELNEAAMTAMADPGLETGWDDQYFRTRPSFETGAAQYQWLQTSIFVARGRVATDGVEYEIFRVE